MYAFRVTVIRLVVPGSVEAGVQRVAQAKLANIEAVMQGHASERGGGLTPADVEAIFAPMEEADEVAAESSLVSMPSPGSWTRWKTQG
jgi:hypothetical protein